MSIFSSLFGKNIVNETAQTHNSSSKTKEKDILGNAKLHLKGEPDVNGLYPAELVMLSLAEGYKTTETNFPRYLMYTYEITNPMKMLKSLQSREYIEIGSPKDILPNLKLTELKKIAASLGVYAKGKKADIVSQLSQTDEKMLAEFIKERVWKLTAKGQAELKANPYIQYFLDKHGYDVSEVGVNIWSVNEEFVKNPTRQYRDIIYMQLNKQMNKASMEFQKNPMSGTADTHRYCECYRLMGLFIEEEGKSYINASDFYFQYLFKRINIYAGLQLLIDYKLFNKDKKYQTEIINRYYGEIQLCPFHKTEILRLIDELGISSDDVRNTMITSFRRTGDKGIMTAEEAADFIIFELSGDIDQSKDMSDKLAKRAIGKII